VFWKGVVVFERALMKMILKMDLSGEAAWVLLKLQVQE